MSILSDKDFQGKTVVVAGAAGFVPSYLSELYLNLGSKVIGLDNFITGSHSNVKILSKYENFEFHEVDVAETLPNLKPHKIDFVFNLASPASPIDFTKIPLEIMKVNSQGAWNLLDLAREHNARFLEASTSEVYGDPLVHPQIESYVGNVNTIGLRSCYDESKRFAEALTMCFHRQYNIDTRIIRIFNTYGPRMRPDDGRVIPNFINQALQGDDITVYGDGSQTRSFCFVTDLVKGIHAVMCSNDPMPFNVGNPEEYSILEAAEIITETLNSKSKIIKTGMLPEDDPKRRCPIITRLQSVSDFEPKISFRDGLTLTANFFREIK